MPALHVSDLKKTYAEVAEGYEKKHGVVQDLEELEAFVAHLQKNAHILDLGGGVGTEAKWFADHGFQVTIFDMSPDMLAIAKAKVPTAKIVQGDMTEMEFEKEQFDGVWARASLLHLTKTEAQKVTKKVFNMLKQNGIFLCSLKKGEGEKEVEDDKYGKKIKRYFSFYEQNDGEQLLKAAGFNNIQSVVDQSSSGQLWVKVWGFKK